MNYQHKEKVRGDAIRADEWNDLGVSLEKVSRHIVDMAKENPVAAPIATPIVTPIVTPEAKAEVKAEPLTRLSGLEKVGIGTDDPQVELEVNGTTWTHDLLARNIRAGQVYINGRPLGDGNDKNAQLSDERLKKNVHNLVDPMMRFMQLRPVSYQWNDHKKISHLPKTPCIGLIANEVEHIFPEAVSEDSDGFKQIDYGSLTAMLIDVVKQQQSVINGLVEKVSQMEGRSSTSSFE